MNVKSLVRDADAVRSTLVVTDSGRVITTTGCRVHIPLFYCEKKLATISDEIYTYGFFPIILPDGKYAVLSVVAPVRIEPDTTTKIKINGEYYYEFGFEKGGTLIGNINLMKVNTLPYHVHNHILSRGNVPWFGTYEDILTIFSTSAKHADFTVGATKSIAEFISSAVCRDPSDKTRFFRYSVNGTEEAKKRTPAYVGLNSVQFRGRSTVSKLINNYFPDSIMAALVFPSDQLDTIEIMLRR